MQEYICIKIAADSREQQEILIARLSEIGFDGFEQTSSELKAFINKSAFDQTRIEKILDDSSLSYSREIVREENWNAKWEAEFKPVIIKDLVAVRADFHPPVHSVKHEIVITPKMSFGTGHHATTSLMLERMNETDFKNKSVLDFGTGTGILAIMAAKLGANKILAIDNDEWSIENAKENFERNKILNTRLLMQDHVQVDEKFDIILANINKHVIIQHLGNLAAILNKGGVVLLSGILTADEQEVADACSEFSLSFVEKSELNDWICLNFVG